MKRFATLVAAALLAGCSPVIHIAAEPLTIAAEPLTLKIELPENLGKVTSPTPAAAPGEKPSLEPPAGNGDSESAAPMKAKPESVAAAAPPEPRRETPENVDGAQPGHNPDLAGFWSSVSASGPGSASVRRVEMVFGDAGDWTATMLFEPEGRSRFQSLDGRWTLAGDCLTVTLSDGRERPWRLSREGETLVLRDGESVLKLERVKESRSPEPSDR